MSITFHCEHCGKKVEAQDNASGKWAKCPACHNRIYVPDLSSGEELKLASTDATDLTEQERLMAETHKLTQDILLEREDPNWSFKASAAEISDKELTKNIIVYLRQMADGELDQAENTVDLIAPCGARAVEILDRIAVSEMPEPELADVPAQVLSGFIRTLRTKIS